MKNYGTALMVKWSDIHLEAIEKREKGFEERMHQLGENVKTISVPAAPSEAEAAKLISNMVKSNEVATVLFATNADWGMLFANYLKKNPLGVDVITIDFTRDMADYIRDGLICFAVSQRNSLWGSLTLENLSKSFSGSALEKYQDTGSFEVNRGNYAIYAGRA